MTNRSETKNEASAPAPASSNGSTTRLQTKHERENIMATFTGNSSVSPGYYLSTKTFAIEVIGNEGGTLPGPNTVKYIAVPFPLLFAVVPVVGLAFLMFLPAIGFFLFGQAVVMRVTGHVADGAGALAATISPDLATGAAYMAGHKDEEKAADKATPEIEKLAKEIEEKRS